MKTLKSILGIKWHTDDADESNTDSHGFSFFSKKSNTPLEGESSKIRLDQRSKISIIRACPQWRVPFIHRMRRIIPLAFLLLFLTTPAFSQVQDAPGDTTLNQDQIYNRPFIYLGKTQTAVGGYVEGNTNYIVDNGVKEGFSMELRRFNIFLYSTIAKRIKFLSELEFEHGTREINLETAQLDFEINPLLVFRAGMILPPLGGFNTNHDSPKWEFVDRPLVSTRIIPSTLSEPGFGFNGKKYTGNWALSYGIYVVNGLQNGVVLNTEGKTFIPAGKSPFLAFKDNNGSPAITGRFGFRNHKWGELGISGYRGAWNNFRSGGEVVADRLPLQILALDYAAVAGNFSITGEFALADISIPSSLPENIGDRQFGGHLDLTWKFLQRKILNWENAHFNLSVRPEFIDLNAGKFTSTALPKGEEEMAISAGLAFRPAAGTILRVVMKRSWNSDVVNNPAIGSGNFQVGFASYF